MAQESIDQVMGTDLRVTDENGDRRYDGIVGSQTRRAVQDVLRAGKIKEINNRFVEKRISHMKTLEHFEVNKNGWLRRARWFRMPLCFIDK